jgi:hypothetical protein
MKILVATDKPFAPVAVTMIREVAEKAGHTLAFWRNTRPPGAACSGLLMPMQ